MSDEKNKLELIYEAVDPVNGKVKSTKQAEVIAYDIINKKEGDKNLALLQVILHMEEDNIDFFTSLLNKKKLEQVVRGNFILKNKTRKNQIKFDYSMGAYLASYSLYNTRGINAHYIKLCIKTNFSTCEKGSCSFTALDNSN